MVTLVDGIIYLAGLFVVADDRELDFALLQLIRQGMVGAVGLGIVFRA